MYKIMRYNKYIYIYIEKYGLKRFKELLKYSLTCYYLLKRLFINLKADVFKVFFRVII